MALLLGCETSRELLHLKEQEELDWAPWQEVLPAEFGSLASPLGFIAKDSVTLVSNPCDSSICLDSEEPFGQGSAKGVSEDPGAKTFRAKTEIFA